LNKPTLIVMAAGIGSRYGGLKQIEPVGPHGEIVMEYSLQDALQAGFGKIVFLIRKEMEDDFRELVGRKIESRAETVYVFQDIANVPADFAVPAGRKKPWGTGHAVLSCQAEVGTPFSVINADDFYGAAAFQTMAKYLGRTENIPGHEEYAMVGYRLSQTLSDHGHVTRGICQITPEGYLGDIHERLRIEKFPDGVKYSDNGTDWISVPASAIVSMNFWGFTPTIFNELSARFPQFLRESEDNILKAEYLLPEVVGALVQEGKARVRVLLSNDRWFGVTYREDLPHVKTEIRRLIVEGVYPDDLWDAATR
jgi:hypothetical protein